MWILHQDKEKILNIDNAASIEYTFNAIHKKEHAVTYCDCSKATCNFIIIGLYPSKERCLEVIQGIVKNIHLKNPIYEMLEK